MSKRPKTANAVMSRLRRPVGRLRDLPIWSKLGLIMLVPTLATIVVGTNGLVDHIDEASNAERARTLALLSEVSGDLVDHLQNERAGAVWVLAARDNGSRDQAMKLYNAEHPLVENATAAVRAAEGRPQRAAGQADRAARPARPQPRGPAVAAQPGGQPVAEAQRGRGELPG